MLSARKVDDTVENFVNFSDFHFIYLLTLFIILGGGKITTTLSPDSSGTPSTIPSVDSSPSAMFRMPARAPAHKDWTPDDSSLSCEECQALFSLVRQLILLLFICHGVLKIIN